MAEKSRYLLVREEVTQGTFRVRQYAVLEHLYTGMTGQDDGARTENVEEILDSDVSSPTPEAAEAVESLKMKERCGNVTENKGSGLEHGEESGNLAENTGSYAVLAGMMLKIR